MQPVKLGYVEKLPDKEMEDGGREGTDKEDG